MSLFTRSGNRMKTATMATKQNQQQKLYNIKSSFFEEIFRKCIGYFDPKLALCIALMHRFLGIVQTAECALGNDSGPFTY